MEAAVAGLILGGERRMRGSCHSCATHGCFIAHLQVFGIISGVVMVSVPHRKTSFSLLRNIEMVTMFWLSEVLVLFRGVPSAVLKCHTSLQSGLVVN